MIDILVKIGFFFMLFSFVIGAIGSLVFMRHNWLANLCGNLFASAGSVFGIIISAVILISGNVVSFNLPTSFTLCTLSIHIDSLSAFFIFIISLISLICSIYGIGYITHFYNKYNIGTLGFFYNIFIAGMILVVTANNGLFFLIVWEIMSLASYFLVIFEHKNEDNIKAGSLYFIMTHIGTAFIIFAFLLLYKTTGSFDFTIIKDNISGISPFTKNTIFVFALIGFGTKAGIIPLHTWLPGAHPAAPSHVSALMSGVMIKTGIYMFIRLFLDILPDAPLWWGYTILIVGSVSSLLGVLYALLEHDIKRLLAYHSIENIGIILLGLGSALVFYALDLKSFAILGLIAALYHTLNHSIFKALLFLGAGSVISKTHTRNIEEYGGLIKYMPQTAFFFLIGSMAISGLPPFNGFFSEWLTFQSLFHGIKSFSFFTQLIFIMAAGSLVFTSGLAAACFVKVFGITFLARPRSEKAKHAKESSFTLRIGMASLAILTLIFGLFAGHVSSLLSKISKSMSIFQNSDSAISTQFQAVKLRDGFAIVSMPGILMSLVLFITVIAIIIYFLTKNQKTRIGITWNCGTPLTPRMEITATGFARSLITIFGGILKPSRQSDIEYRDANLRYFQKLNIATIGTRHDIYNTYLYKPLQRLITIIADYVKTIQSGNINGYILYIFITLMSLLLLFVI